MSLREREIDYVSDKATVRTHCIVMCHLLTDGHGLILKIESYFCYDCVIAAV